MTIDIFSQIPGFLKELISLCKEPFDIRRQQRILFFSNNIENIHKSMIEIHEDYMKNFEELLDLFNEKKNISRTIELLRKKRLILVTKRKDVLSYSKDLENLKKRLYLREKEIELFVKYSDAIKNYFIYASPVDNRVSWFSDFINLFESLEETNESFNHEYYRQIISSGKSPVDIVKNAYQDALHYDIPNSWANYSEKYYELKLHFLK